MHDGISQLFTCFNGDGDVLVGRLQGVLLLGKGAHGEHKERREDKFFHNDVDLCRQKYGNCRMKKRKK